MSSAAERLLPPLNTADVFKHSRGKVARIKAARDFSPGAVLSSRDKASGIAARRSETMIKFDHAGSGIKSGSHLNAAADYMARHGELQLEDEEGRQLSREEMQQRLKEWCQDQKIPAEPDENDKKRPADARRCIVSCPAGTDPEKMMAAARQLGREIFGEQGYQYLMVMHCRDKDHPKEPPHPHVHFLIKAVNEDGRRLNPRKSDLQYMRERFAVLAREQGIEMNATPRAVRGQTAKAKTQAQYHEEKRQQQKQSQAQKWAIDRKKKQLAAKAGKTHPYTKARRDELRQAVISGQELPDHPVLVKAKRTRVKVQQNAAAYIKELKTSGRSEDLKLAAALEQRYQNLGPVESAQQQKLRIAKRKAAEKLAAQAAEKQDIKRRVQETARAAAKAAAQKQSQAQKWAIDRKKKQLQQKRQKGQER